MAQVQSDGLDNFRRWLVPGLLFIISVLGGFWANSMKDGQEKAATDIKTLTLLVTEIKTGQAKDIEYTKKEADETKANLVKTDERVEVINGTLNQHIQVSTDFGEALWRLRRKAGK